jgi:hypothetical protein
LVIIQADNVAGRLLYLFFFIFAPLSSNSSFASPKSLPGDERKEDTGKKSLSGAGKIFPKKN